jgi:hypothetical protein
MTQIDDRLQRRLQQVLLTVVPRLRHRAPPTAMTPRPGIAQTGQNRNPKSPDANRAPAQWLAFIGAKATAPKHVTPAEVRR